jgi:hypothetical protein
MAFGMAHKAGECVPVIDFMSCIVAVAKQPWYGRLKINPSYNIDRYHVLICSYNMAAHQQ